jgi:ABC-type polysaccharide/polyol phosphate export permease
MTSSFRTFCYFLWRDFYIYLKHVPDFAINNVLLYPIIQGLTFLYLQPSIFFGGHNPNVNTMMFIGNILLLMMVLTYKMTIPLLFDLDQNRFIDYQISIMRPHLVLFQRILFTSFATWLLLAPAFPIVQLYFPTYFDTSATSWWKVMLALYCGSLFCAAYHTFMACTLSSPRDIRRLWIRYNQLLFQLGGFSIPWHIVNKASPILGYLTRLNPMMYITEGLRQAFLNDARFFPYWISIGVLLIASWGMTMLAWRSFKKRVDHV